MPKATERAMGPVQAAAVGPTGGQRPSGLAGRNRSAIAQGRLRADEPRDAQWLTNCLTPWLIDRAVGDMKLDSQSGPQLATYVRLKTDLSVDLASDKLERIRKMDDPSNLSDLTDLAQRTAAAQVKPEHLPATFDLARRRLEDSQRSATACPR